MRFSALSAIAYSATSHKQFVMSPPSRRLVLHEQKVGQGEVGWYIQTAWLCLGLAVKIPQ